MTVPWLNHDESVILRSAKLAALGQRVYERIMPSGGQRILLSLGLVGALLSESPGQIDATLFGDNLGPAIADLPDTGEEYLVVEPSAVAADPVPLQPDANLPNLPAAPPQTNQGAPEANVKAPPPKELPTSKRKRSWLPWRNKKLEREERLRKEREKTAPRLGAVRSGASQGGGNVDSGLLPSELSRWKRDPRKAMVQARDERKLLLLWMTDSLRSSTSKSMATEVFRHTRFLRMAKDHMVLTKIDFAEADIANHAYTRYLKAKLGVVGYPALILFNADSQEVWRFRGYRRGRFPKILEDLHYRVKTHALQERLRLEKMEKSGYRTWSNDRDQTMFAKALEVSREDRTVLLLDEQGEKFHYPVVSLSDEDRKWLAERFLR